MNLDRLKSGSVPFALGLALVAAGLIANEATLARLSSDGSLSLVTRVEIWAIDAALVLVGLAFMWDRKLWSPRVVLVFSVAAIACGSLFATLEAYTLYGADHALGNDDAFISYRYARNLVEGHGLVFNPGERVEGYSNLLYVLLVAPSLFWGDDLVYPFATVLNLGFLIAAFFIFYRFVERELGEAHALVGAVLFATSPLLWLWASSGMEPALVVLLQIGLWVAVEKLAREPSPKGVAGFAAIAVLCVLVRADGFITPALGVFYLWLRGRRHEAIRTGSLLGLSVGGLFLWRYVYYGYIFPNTYYVKVSGPLVQRVLHGVGQLVEVGVATGLVVYLLVLGVSVIETSMATARSRSFETLRFDSVFSAGWIGYWIYIGGDHFAERFLIILGPVGIYAFLRAFPWSSMGRRALAHVVPIVLVTQLAPLMSDSRFAFGGQKYDMWVTAGKFLAREHPGAFLATGAAGKVPFFSGLRTLDMLGLNDEFIGHSEARSFDEPGHNKWDEDYVLSKEPDLIATWIISVPTLDLLYGLERAKYSSAGFRFKYLVNSSIRGREENIIDVSRSEESEIRDLAADSYRFAILERVRE